MARKVQGIQCPNCNSTLYEGVEGVNGDNIVVCMDQSEDPPTGCLAAWDISALRDARDEEVTNPLAELAAPEMGSRPPLEEGEEAPAPIVATPPAEQEGGTAEEVATGTQS